MQASCKSWFWLWTGGLEKKGAAAFSVSSIPIKTSQADCGNLLMEKLLTGKSQIENAASLLKAFLSDSFSVG